ncbi:MAG: hypothetical protein ACE147_05410 [Candidatus Methylomirabilales bacterium]
MPSVVRAQRHAACACGRGQPFAACCALWEEAFQKLAARLIAFAHLPPLRPRVEEAETVFDPAGVHRDPTHRLGDLRFLEWFLHDFEPEPGRGTLLGEFADRTGPLPWHEAQLLFGLLLAPLRGYQVAETLGPRGLLLRDLASGAEGPAGPLGVPDTAIRSDLLVGRLVGLGSGRRPGLSLLRLPASAREELMAYLRAAYRMARPGRHVSFEDFLDGGAHLYHHFFESRGRALAGEAVGTARPEAHAPGLARYAVQDEARVRAVLARQPEIEAPAAEADGFVWLDLASGTARARLRLAAQRLEVGADTREALRDVRRFVEGALRGLIQLPPALELAPPATSPAEAAERPRGARFLRRALAHWPDTPAAALQGRTPRAALGTRTGRQEVEALLLALERDLARQKRLGRAWAEVGPLRAALGLGEEPPPAAPRGPRR